MDNRRQHPGAQKKPKERKCLHKEWHLLSAQEIRVRGGSGGGIIRFLLALLIHLSEKGVFYLSVSYNFHTH